MHPDNNANNLFSPSALRTLRYVAGLSRTQLAAAVNVSAGTIGRYERGEHCPSMGTFHLLAEVLDVDPADLLLGGGR